MIAHNLLRAAGTLAGGNHAVARGATLRRDLVNVPARFAAPARKPTLHLPAHWPWQIGWKTLWDNVIGYPDRATPRRLTPPSSLSTRHPRPDPRNTRKAGTGQRITHAHTVPNRPMCRVNHATTTKSPIHGFRLSSSANSEKRLMSQSSC